MTTICLAWSLMHPALIDENQRFGRELARVRPPRCSLLQRSRSIAGSRLFFASSPVKCALGSWESLSRAHRASVPRGHSVAAIGGIVMCL
jgi:hypothetical protein